jgi:5-methylcytosine-specific restriction endonuclease McrA
VIDYQKLALPKKGARTKKTRKPLRAMRPRQRKILDAAAVDRVRVFARQNWTCFAAQVSPVCRQKLQDPHELIPVGRGGKRESWNRVGLCRPCHRAAQGRVGGIRLLFDWDGRAEGRLPNADKPGNVRCRWKDGPGGTG